MALQIYVMFWKSLQGTVPGWGSHGSEEEATKSPAAIWGKEDEAMGGLLGGLEALEASPCRGSEAVAEEGRRVSPQELHQPTLLFAFWRWMPAVSSKATPRFSASVASHFCPTC